MNSPTPRAVHPLVESWIETATEGLAETARDRVCEEILDHVLEAVDSATAESADAESAFERAVVSLGDAARAGRALRCTNLRPWEAKLVGDLSRSQPPLDLALCLAGLPAFVAVNIDLMGGSPAIWILVVGLACMMLGIAGCF